MLSFSSSRNEPECYIDPRKTILGVGDGVDDPNYNFTAVQPEDNEDFDLEEDLPTQYQFTPLKPSFDPSIYAQHLRNTDHDPFLAAPAPSTPPSKLRPEAEPFKPKSPQRPQLSVVTTPQQSADGHQSTVTPRTPQIQVSAPPDSWSHPSSGGQRNGRQTARTRRKSSPGRRPPPASRRYHPAGLSGVLQTNRSGNAHLSPVTPESWVMGGPYNPGDRSTSVMAAHPMPAPSTPRRTPSRSSRTPSRSTGPYYCDHLDCDKPNKQWETPSALTKHQKIHMPEAERRFGCVECPRRFLYPKDLSRHKESVHQGSQQICPTCGESLSREDNLRRHIDLKHSGVATPMSANRTTPASPSASSVTSFAQSSYSGTLPSTPLTFSPALPAEAATRPTQGHSQIRSIGPTNEEEDPFVGLGLSLGSPTPFFPPGMTRSRSNGI